MKNLFVSCFEELKTLPEVVDALFILNQEAEPEQIKHLVDEFGITSAIIVTSHAPFPDEQEAFRFVLGAVRLYWIPMSWLLTDGEMEACDDQAVDELTSDGGRFDAGAFFERSRYLRNLRASMNLGQRVRWERVYACQGLGVICAAWQRALPLELVKRQQVKPPRTFIKRIFGRLQGRQAESSIEVVEDGTIAYAFIGGSTNRLRFRDQARRHLIKGRSGSFNSESSQDIQAHLVEKASRQFSTLPIQVATTVHNFSPWMLARYPDLRVFVDGLHPPNYPVSYGPMYRGTQIVSREDCDRRWFEKCGCTVLPPASILAPELPYLEPNTVNLIRNICLMLNHAGDWSALIDRSDTDLTVMAFTEAVGSIPELNFRVRAHPTMAIREHEGIGSLVRLRQRVASLQLKNLQFSTASLDDDIAWTDCCVSEYSNVLIDCMKIGKLCLVLNTTNRRSFLEHLSPLGLRTVHDSHELIDFLQPIS